MLRTVILIIVALATAVWLLFLAIAFTVDTDSMGEGIVMAGFAMIPSAAFILLTLPAFFLALKQRFLGLSLVLALLSLLSMALLA